MAQDPSDVRMLAVARHQDRTAFGKLFSHFASRLKSWIIRTGSSPDSADDLVQDAFVQRWRKANAHVCRDVQAALAQLNEDQRTLVQLSFYEDKSHCAIAAEMSLPLGTVKTDSTVWPQPVVRANNECICLASVEGLFVHDGLIARWARAPIGM